MIQDRIRIYGNAKEVFSILGPLKEAREDPQNQKFFDIALMNYLREFSGEKSNYCMLCNKNEQTIINSHVISLGILKEISEGKVYSMGPSGQSKDYNVKPLGQLTYKMLCKTCDNKELSRDEKSFLENIMRPIYHTSSSSHFDGIPYDKWLHRFCVGIIFRAITFSRNFINSDEVYELFCYCRSVLIPEESATQEFDIAIFFTPGKDQPLNLGKDQPLSLFTPGKDQSLDDFVRYLNYDVFFRLSNIPISGPGANLAIKSYYFAVHFGIFTIVAFIEPVPGECRKFLVLPDGTADSRKLNIPSNSDRLGSIPSGLLNLFNEKFKKHIQQYVEFLCERKENQGNIKISTDALKNNKLDNFCLLPSGYEIDRQRNLLVVKEGHTILLHYTYQQESFSVTRFLAVEDVAPMEPYVIVNVYLHSSTNSQTYLYYVSLPEFEFRKDFDKDHEAFMKTFKEMGYCKPAKGFITKMKSVGLQNYQSILYHFER